MGFDLKAFDNAQLVPRTASVPVPGLADWFGLDDGQREKLNALAGSEQEQCAVELGVVWQVRGLSDDELNQAESDAKGNRAKIADVMAEMMQLQQQDAEGIKEKLGMSELVGLQTCIRAEHIYRGSVEPKLKIQQAHKLGRNFPIEFRVIATKILELSGLGAIDEKKLNPSGVTKKSK